MEGSRRERELENLVRQYESIVKSQANWVRICAAMSVFSLIATVIIMSILIKDNEPEPVLKYTNHQDIGKQPSVELDQKSTAEDTSSDSKGETETFTFESSETTDSLETSKEPEDIESFTTMEEPEKTFELSAPEPDHKKAVPVQPVKEVSKEASTPLQEEDEWSQFEIKEEPKKIEKVQKPVIVDEFSLPGMNATNSRVIRHRVRKGESLSRLSLLYYKNIKKSSIRRIREYNGLRNNTIMVDSIIEIPIP